MYNERKMYHLSEVTSTNELAKQLLNDNILTGGSWILADWQSAGKGQEKTSWESNKGENILCSTIIFPIGLSVDDQVYLNLAVCLAVYDVVSLYCSNVYIKWPNDVYVNHQKIAGILIENSIQGSMLKSSIIGIGLNVNQQSFNVLHATSLALNLQKQLMVNNVFLELQQAWQKRHQQLLQKQFQLLWDQYHLYLYKKDETSVFTVNGKTLKGIVRGIDRNGRLKVLIDEAEQLFQVKEIAWQEHVY